MSTTSTGEATAAPDSTANANDDAIWIDAGLLAVSAAILTLEILETKIFAYSLDAISIYLAISVCLLGLGASATGLAILPPIPATRVRAIASAFAAVGGACVLLSHSVFSRLAPALAGDNVVASSGIGGETSVVLIALMSPYLCFGVVVALVLQARGEAVGRAYAFNLAGSALGCLLVFPLLDALGAERALVVVAALALVGGALMAPRTRTSAAFLAAMALALAVFFPLAPKILVFPPEEFGQLNRINVKAEQLEVQNPGETVRVEHLHKEWNRTARVDVYRLESSIEKLRGRPVESLFFVQDSSAGSILLGVGDDLASGRAFFEDTVYGLGYVLRAPRDALVIGLGGAPDILTALHHGAGQITGVDINGATIELVRDEFSDYQGAPYARPNVDLVRMDGRTFLRATDEQFDLIQMSGVDTKSVFAAGSLSVNENYIYTLEAFIDIFTHLRPDGLLAVIRFGDADVHRLTTGAVEALRALGADAPERHVFVIGQGFA